MLKVQPFLQSVLTRKNIIREMILNSPFPAPENARAIITLENSAGVLEEIRVNTVKTNTVVKIKAKPEMAPNVYAYVTVIQPHSQTVNDMPVRLYGVVPVMVEDHNKACTTDHCCQ